MGNIFNNDKKKPKAQSSRITDLDRAVLGLKKQRDQLMKMQKQIEVGCEPHVVNTGIHDMVLRPPRDGLWIPGRGTNQSNF